MASPVPYYLIQFRLVSADACPGGDRPSAFAIDVSRILPPKGDDAMSDVAAIAWYGQACIAFTSPAGTSVLVDPFDPAIGYRLPDLEPDVVVVTHEHYDHANVAGVRGHPRVLRGLAPGGRWADLDQTIGDVRIRTVGTYHDEVHGAKRGANSLVCLDLGGLKAVHCGDLGHLLADEQVRAVGPADVLILPVGGIYTLNADEARQVVGQLGPRLAVIPIHYKTDPLTISLEPIDPFLAGWKRVRRLQTNEVRLPLQAPPGAREPEVIVLDYRPASP